MKYLLIAQFNEELGLDKLIEMEDILINNLTNLADVDGHDIGSGEMNIFIFTDSPNELSNEILYLFKTDTQLISNIKIAYREVDEDKYIVLWPRTLNKLKVI